MSPLVLNLFLNKSVHIGALDPEAWTYLVAGLLFRGLDVATCQASGHSADLADDADTFAGVRFRAWVC